MAIFLPGCITCDTILFVGTTSVTGVNTTMKVDFTSFLPRFAGSDVLIQCTCMSTIAHSLLNQTLCGSNVAL